MIDQGKKGYCAAATLARVLQYYGYVVDQHALAELAETEGQASECTRRYAQENIIRAMQRVCNGTPFKLKSIRKPQPHALLEVIEQGLPIIWFIPGHARLLTGIHQIRMKLSFQIPGAQPITIRLVRGIIFVIIMLNYGILNFKSLPDGFHINNSSACN